MRVYTVCLCGAKMPVPMCPGTELVSEVPKWWHRCPALSSTWYHKEAIAYFCIVYCILPKVRSNYENTKQTWSYS